MTYSPLTIFHISAATVALVAGTAAMVFRKGSRGHALSGSVFGASMLAMSGSGASLAFARAQPVNFVMGVLTFYLVATGWRTARRRDGRTGIFEWAALAVALALTVGLGFGGVQAWRSATGRYEGLPAWFFCVWGSVILLAAVGDVRVMVRGGVFGRQRIARHLWRMCLGFFIAVLSFFVGQQKVMPVYMRGSALLYVPPLLVLGALIHWVFRASRSRVLTTAESVVLRNWSHTKTIL